MRIVIAEDSTLFREGLASLLTDAGHTIVARVADATSLLDAVRDQLPDLAIVDVRMPPDHTDDGARAAMLLRASHPQLGIMLLSQHIETTHSVHLVSTGAFGYLLKDRVLDVEDFLDALQRVASGGSALDPEVVSRLISIKRPRTAGHIDPTRTRRARPDGPGPHQRRHRRTTVPVRANSRNPHRQPVGEDRDRTRRPRGTDGC